jgi:hypothetical protein
MAVDDHITTPQATFKQRAIFRAILRERTRQEQLKAAGKFLYTCADPNMLSSEKCLVLTEECGEVARACLNLQNFSRDYGADLGKVREELVQVAAVCLAWLEFIEGVTGPLPGLEILNDNPKEGADGAEISGIVAL